MAKAKVFSFTVFDIVSGDNKLSPTMATRSALERIPTASIQPGSRIEIDAALLDGNGMIARTLAMSAS